MSMEMQKLILRCIYLLISCLIEALHGQPMPRMFSVLQETVPDVSYWTYGDSDHGPMFWPQLFPRFCAGKHQSPVNIQTAETIYDPTLKDFVIFYDPPSAGSSFQVHNNGHAVEVNTVGKFYVSNGGLKHLYQTAQFHFHWGLNSFRGSEHTINGSPSPIEMHIVNFNRDKYRSADEAARYPDGLAVLSILFKLSKEDNPQLEPIVRVLERVRDPDEHVLVTIPAISMKDFLPKNPDRYFRYSGSLTTPNCSETVIWTVFEEKQSISERQLYFFRQMFTSSLHLENRLWSPLNIFQQQGRRRVILADNFRPIQNMADRRVYRSFPSLKAPSYTNRISCQSSHMSRKKNIFHLQQFNCIKTGTLKQLLTMHRNCQRKNFLCFYMKMCSMEGRY